jgi:hypothetical protein
MLTADELNLANVRKKLKVIPAESVPEPSFGVRY